MPATVGQPAPDFNLRDQKNEPVTLESLKGHKALIVFIPGPFTSICEGEVCAIRDDQASLENLGAKVVIITNYPRPANAKWAEQLGVSFPILSDYWPHGAVSQAYGSFNETFGLTMRWSFVLDKDGVVRAIIKTDALPEAREHAAYQRALSAFN
ncbi:MAG TPA: redoxin domain-containing protein [Dehalococcoidia bacterium]|nr:redoxin domain-containing protein [Dehalococcoidia bacterium]